VADAVAVVLTVEQVPEGGGAELDLVDTRPVDVARHREEPGSHALLCAEGGEGRTAVADDPRQVGQRLDVVDHGRLHVEALGGREVRRLEAGKAPVALERLDERGLLAHDVGAGAPVQDHVDGEVVVAHDAPADVAGGIGLVERLGDSFLGQRHLAAHVQEDLCGTDGVTRDERALDEQVGIPLHDDAVLVGARLGLVAVDHQVAGEHTGRDEAPLDSGGEARPAAAEQARGLDLLGDLVGGHGGQRPLEALVAAGLEVALERVPVGEAPARAEDAGDVLGVGVRVGAGVHRTASIDALDRRE
jgi:hypothetical protein